MTELKHIAESFGILLAAIFVFVIQAGLLSREAGLTRGKNSANVAAKSLVSISVSFLLFWLLGFGLMFGLSDQALGGYGTTGFGLDFVTNLPVGIAEIAQRYGGQIVPFFFFQAMLCVIAAGIASGASSERIRFESAVLITIVFAGLIYPIAGHWVWGGLDAGSPSGWLAQRGFVDFSGATVIHSVAGWSALATVILVKPRLGAFNLVGQGQRLPKSSPVLATLGTFLVWLGWFGLVGGKALMGGKMLIGGGSVDLVLINTLLAGAVGVVAVIPASILFRSGHLDYEILLNGALAGLVSVTAVIHAITPQQVVIVAMIGAWLMLLLRSGLINLRVDDAVGTIPVHLAAGIWGTAAVALFGNPTILNTGLSPFDQLTTQLMGIFAVGGWTFLVTLICLNAIQLIFPLRVDEAEEVIGLNIAEQGELPDYSEFPGLGDLLSRR